MEIFLEDVIEKDPHKKDQHQQHSLKDSQKKKKKEPITGGIVHVDKLKFLMKCVQILVLVNSIIAQRSKIKDLSYKPFLFSTSVREVRNYKKCNPLTLITKLNVNTSVALRVETVSEDFALMTDYDHLPVALSQSR
uniref:Uncharacterized protein n=1 Tax=Glossina pallidipes TaxID=7398 RepID=A0A1A9Z0G3_GLOPL